MDMLLPIHDSEVIDHLSFSPREARLLRTLQVRDECSRHDLDRLVGAENSPDIVMLLRKKHGLDIPMVKRKMIDRDGRATYPGYYSFSDRDRCRLAVFFAASGGE